PLIISSGATGVCLRQSRLTVEPGDGGEYIGEHRSLLESLSSRQRIAMRVTLQVTDGPHKGQTFTFVNHDTFLVGRSRRAHLRLPAKDMYFSRVHFLVEINPPQCRLLDLGSRNGTYVNGQRVETVDLADGDQIKAGHTVFRLTLTEESSSVLSVAPVATP